MTETETIAAIRSVIGNPKDKCYVASEALYHLLGGRASGYRPAVVRIKTHKPLRTHWYLLRPDKTVLDITADQFNFKLNYKEGHRCGWLTGEKPSRRAQEIINAVNNLERD